MSFSYATYSQISNMADELVLRYRGLLASGNVGEGLNRTKQDLYVLLWLCIYYWSERGFSNYINSLYRNQKGARKLFIVARYPSHLPPGHLTANLTSLRRYELDDQPVVDERKECLTFGAFEGVVDRVDELLILVFAGHDGDASDDGGQNYPAYIDAWDEQSNESFTDWLKGKLSFFMKKRDKLMPVSSNDWFLARAADLTSDSRVFTSGFPSEEPDEDQDGTSLGANYAGGGKRADGEADSQEQDWRCYETVEAAMRGIGSLLNCRNEDRYSCLRANFEDLSAMCHERRMVDGGESILDEFNLLVVDIACEDVQKLFDSKDVAIRDKRYERAREQFAVLLKERNEIAGLSRPLDSSHDRLIKELRKLYGEVKQIRNTFPENPDMRGGAFAAKFLYDANAHRETEELVAGKWALYKQLMAQPLEKYFGEVAAFELSAELCDISPALPVTGAEVMAKPHSGPLSSVRCCSKRAAVAYLLWFIQCCRPLCDYRSDRYEIREEVDGEIKAKTVEKRYTKVDLNVYAPDKLHDFIDARKEETACQLRKKRFIWMLTNRPRVWLFDGSDSLERLVQATNALVSELFAQELPLDDFFAGMNSGCRSVALLPVLDEPNAEVAYAWAKACAKDTNDSYKVFCAQWKASALQAGFAPNA